MARKLLQGLKTFKMGAKGADGAMGATLVAYGKIVKSSALITFDPPGTTKVEIEDSSSPLAILTNGSIVRKVEIGLYDMTVGNLNKFFGGTVATGKWSAPIEYTAIEQSVEITSKDIDGTHYVVTIPNGYIAASFDGKLNSEGLGSIKLTIEPQAVYNATGVELASIHIEEVTV